MKARNRLDAPEGNDESVVTFIIHRDMHQIDINKAEKWPDPGKGRGARGPRHIDSHCPHEGCGKPTFGIQLNWQFHTRSAVTEIKCAGCENRITYVMTNAPVGCTSPENSKTVIYQDF